MQSNRYLTPCFATRLHSNTCAVFYRIGKHELASFDVFVLVEIFPIQQCAPNAAHSKNLPGPSQVVDEAVAQHKLEGFGPCRGGKQGRGSNHHTPDDLAQRSRVGGLLFITNIAP